MCSSDLKSNVDINSANALRSIAESSPYGGSTAAAIAAVLNKSNQNLVNLDAKQGEYRREGEKTALDQLINVSNQKEALSKEQLDQKEKLKAMADRLMQAYYSYRTGALEETTQGLKSLGSSFSSMGGMGGGGGASGGGGGV